jgi:hypothetical protein
MDAEHIDWMEFARRLAEGARAKLAEDRKFLEELRTNLKSNQVNSVPTPSK